MKDKKVLTIEEMDAEIKEITGFTFDELPRWLRRQNKNKRGVPNKGHAESDILKDIRNW